ncbi:hypothetical protein SAMN03159376_02091 [Pseudomonas sp. NFACC09-4]|uniref:hypothetical protein n=1 Tax=Pseudomonas sp. NFACC09-4 TaxID=1566237 RepID=UPI000908D857|nr:hypothetical protein [Pseudomonas sp. NFACC09-4]SFW54325.1 hypothetical protein SAMN03159376_02091 [Pseudomonas sp. NFACC09-4]
MHRIDGPGATVDNKFTEGDPVSAVPATEVTGDWLNAVQEEIAAVIVSAGLTLNKANNAQLLAAITQKITAAIPASPPDASTTVKGLIELATDPEVQAGADTLRAITPASLKAAYGLGDSTLVTDLNNAGQGYFYAGPGAANSPGSGIVLGETRGASGTAAKSQICIDVSTKIIYKRTFSASWSPWTSLIDADTAAATYQRKFSIHARDEKPSGTGGGNSVAGDQTRILNTVVTNTIVGASLASNQITLPAGTYRVQARSPYFGGDRHRAFVYNVTSGAVAALGSCENAGAAFTTQSLVAGTVTIATTSVFELRHYMQTVTTNGLGDISADGRAEVYAELIFEQV